MSLKQLLFAEDAHSKLPFIIQTIQSGNLPPSQLVDIFSSLPGLLNGKLPARKIGLAVLRPCILYLYKTNKISDTIDQVVKWWKGVVNNMRTRYSADATYRLACANAALLVQVSASYVDLQTEGRLHVQSLVQSCTDVPCKESVDLLLTLARHHPAHIGKQYDQIRTFCLAHSTGEHCERSAQVLAQLTLVGPAGKQSTTYIASWGKLMSGCVAGVRNAITRVAGQDTDIGVSFKGFKVEEFSGTMDCVSNTNKEISFLTTCIVALLKLNLDLPVTFPLKDVCALIGEVTAVYTLSLTYSSTSENLSRRVVVNHAVGETLKMLRSVTRALHSTVHIIQGAVEGLLISLLQQSQHTSLLLDLVAEMVAVGCTQLPFTPLTHLLTLNSLRMKGAVTKKQKTDQFNSFTFETSTLGYTDMGHVTKVLEILEQVLISHGTTLPTLKVDLLERQVQALLANTSHLPDNVVKGAYKVLTIIARQKFDSQSVFSLASSIKDSRHHKFFCNELFGVEPHIHPERVSFRQGSTEHKHTFTPVVQPQHTATLGSSFEKSVWEDLPHGRVDVASSSEATNQNMPSNDVDMESGDDGEIHDVGPETTDVMTIDDRTHVTIPQNFQFHTETNDKTGPKAEMTADVLKTTDDTDKENLDENSEQLNDILASFVDEPPSGDEC